MYILIDSPQIHSGCRYLQDETRNVFFRDQLHPLFLLINCVRWIILSSFHLFVIAQLPIWIFSRRTSASSQLWLLLTWQRKSCFPWVVCVLSFKTWKGWWSWTTRTFSLWKQWKLSLMISIWVSRSGKQLAESALALIYCWPPPKKSIPRKSLCLLPSRLIKSSPLRSLWLPQRLLFWSSSEPVQPLKVIMKHCKHLFSSLSIAAVFCLSQ